MEYPFALPDALAYKFGYRDLYRSAAIAQYASGTSKFSLLDAGVIGTPTCRPLAINGMEDSIFPIEDTLRATTDGDNKDLVVRGIVATWAIRAPKTSSTSGSTTPSQPGSGDAPARGRPGAGG